MQLNLARKGNGLNGGWHKGAIAILMKGVFDKGRCWKDDKSGDCLPLTGLFSLPNGGKMVFMNLLLHSCCHFEGGDSLIGFALEGYCRCCFLPRNRYLRNPEICQKTCISDPFCGGVQGMMGKKVCFLIVCGIVCCELFSEILIFFLC